MARVCRQCGKGLSQYNPGKLCFACEEKRLKEVVTDDEDLIDAEAFAHILGLESAESVKRKARQGDKLPPRIPGIRKYLWRRSVVEEWIKQGGFGNKEFRAVARGIASNLRRCYNDPIIRAPFDTIGSNVYGSEIVIGMTAMGTGPVELVKIDKTAALNMLKQLPRENFPELTGITDWADLAYGRIAEDFIIRLESYY
jgi:hypothetical protein